MATQTTNLGLVKPDSNEFFNIQDFNDNADKIDEAIASKANAARKYTVVLPATGWSGIAPFTQTVTVLGIIDTDEPDMDILFSDSYETKKLEEKSFAYISQYNTGDGYVTFQCFYKVPTIDITVRLKVVK